jgi:hypothetical protein
LPIRKSVARLCGFPVSVPVGIANNVNYGAENIAASIAKLDQLGLLHTGAGVNLAAARAPAIMARAAARFIGRPTTKLTPIRPALPCFAGIPLIMCGRAGFLQTYRRQTDLACRHLS